MCLRLPLASRLRCITLSVVFPWYVRFVATDERKRSHVAFSPPPPPPSWVYAKRSWAARGPTRGADARARTRKTIAGGFPSSFHRRGVLSPAKAADGKTRTHRAWLEGARIDKESCLCIVNRPATNFSETQRHPIELYSLLSIRHETRDLSLLLAKGSCRPTGPLLNIQGPRRKAEAA